MAAESFEVKDFVWAKNKMKGSLPWPGQIVLPPAEAKPKKNHHYVFFFGSENQAWILDKNIQLHSEKQVEKYGNKKTGLYQRAMDTIIERSKGITKYRRSKESSETPDGESVSSTKEPEENNLDKSANSEVKSKTKSLSSSNSSSTPKKFKKLSIKKLSSVKKNSFVKKTVRKRAHSSDESDLDSYSPPSYGLSEIFNRSTEPYSPKSLRFEESYAQLMSNISPNLSYSADGICSSLTPVTAGLLQRKYQDRPDTPPINLTYQSDALKKKKIEPTSKKIGFLGLGKISQGIVKNLYHSGHSIIIWNQTPNECKDFADKFKIQIAATPADVIDAADITFSCVSDTDNAKQNVFGNHGILKELEHRNGERKGYVEMTSMDPKCSETIGQEIRLKGGRYLEAPLSGSRIDANESTLLVVAAGDDSLYEECKSCFDAISKRHVFLGTEVGTAFKLGLIHNMFVGTVYAAEAEALTLLKHIGLEGLTEKFLDILKDGVISSQNIWEKGTAMLKKEYVCNTSLKQTQQDFNLGLSLGHKLKQPTPIFAATNEVYKRCLAMKYGDHDVSAVFEGTYH